MNAPQLAVACMDPATRNLIQLTLSTDCEVRVAQVMGGNSETRKELLRQAGILI
jgi:DNA gyrase/topoisomerase IV subunit B